MANEKELMDAVFGEEEPLLPDGWQEGDTLFPEDEQDVSSFGADGSQDLESLTAENEDGNSESDDPTTVEQDDEESQSDDDGVEDTPDEDGTPQTKTSRILKLKVNHNEEEIDVDSMSDEELAAVIQKGRAFDEWKERENKKRFREVYQEQLDAGMTEAAAKLIAQNEAGGKSYSLTDEPEPTSTPATVSTSSVAEPETPVRNLRAEVKQVKALYKEVDQIPDEVVRMANDAGVSLLDAYQAYRTAQAEKTAASKEKENRILKQNAASAAKAPVRGVSGGGVTHKKVDVFEKGFDSVDW